MEMSAGRRRDGRADRVGFAADIVALFFVSVETEMVGSVMRKCDRIKRRGR
jgi:hypothetical protein